VLPGRVILQPAMAGPLADPLPLASARVRLRRFRADDLERFQAYRHDPDVGRYQGWAPTSDERARAFIEEMAAEEFGRPGDWLQIAVAGAGDALIGDIGLRVMAGGTEAEFGITLARAAQGQGLAEEAARTLIEGLRSRTRVRRLIAIADTRNLASVRLLRRLGMTLEAEEPSELHGEPCREWRFGLAL
jgi:RimJ/RimL family protein N-acetyltransferase